MLGKLGLLPWQTLAKRVEDVVHENEVDLSSMKTQKVPVEANMTIAENLEKELENVQNRLIYQRKLEKFIPAIYQYLMNKDHWNTETHKLK